MFVRSPRRFAILSFVAFVFILAVLQQSPWANERVYEKVSLLKDAYRNHQEPIQNSSQEQPQAHLEDAWQHAVPVATPTPTPSATVKSPSSEPVSKTKPRPPWVTAPSRIGKFIPPFTRPADMKEYMKKMLNWGRPSWDGHWPPFSDYINKV